MDGSGVLLPLGGQRGPEGERVDDDQGSPDPLGLCDRAGHEGGPLRLRPGGVSGEDANPLDGGELVAERCGAFLAQVDDGSTVDLAPEEA